MTSEKITLNTQMMLKSKMSKRRALNSTSIKSGCRSISRSASSAQHRTPVRRRTRRCRWFRQALTVATVRKGRMARAVAIMPASSVLKTMRWLQARRGTRSNLTLLSNGQRARHQARNKFQKRTIASQFKDLDTISMRLLSLKMMRE